LAWAVYPDIPAYERWVLVRDAILALARRDSDTDQYRNSRSSGEIASRVHAGMVPCWTSAIGEYVLGSGRFTDDFAAAPNPENISHCGVQPCRGYKGSNPIRMYRYLLGEKWLMCAGLRRNPSLFLRGCQLADVFQG
jgi:hypothetical protein